MMKQYITGSVLFSAIIIATSTALAQDNKTNPPTSAPATAQRGSDKVDLKKLEDKYWSAKDDDYGVIQNRTFSKAGKVYLSAVYGPLMNDPFVVSRATGLMFGYYFTEDFGLELSTLTYNSQNNETVTRINSIQNAALSPNYNMLASNLAISATYTPFYAKMAFMNKSIMYFDMGFTAGIGTTSYNQVVRLRDVGGGTVLGEEKRKKTAPHFEIGVMQQLFVTKNVAFRLDIKNTFYSSKIAQYELGTGQAESARLEETKSTNDTTISFGLTLFTN